MKIAYLVSCYPAISHTFILREVRFLREHGVDIQVFSINPPDRHRSNLTKNEQEEMDLSVCIKGLSFFEILQSVTSFILRHPWDYLKGLYYSLRLGKGCLFQTVKSLFYFVEAILIYKRMRKLDIAHIHVHFANPACSAALILSKIAPLTYSITVHGPDEFYDVSMNRLYEKIQGALFICCISFYAKSQVMRLSSPQCWSKFDVVRLGVFPEHFKPCMEQEKKAPLEILSIGRLAPAKGFHTLITAVSMLLKEGALISLTIVGDGPLKAELKELTRVLNIEEDVRFTGAVNQDSIGSYFQKADLFCLASFAEGIPIALMEAMAMEIPCIATAINGIPELIEDSVDGLLIPPADEISLSLAIKKCAENKDLRRRLGKAGRDKILKNYNLNINGLSLFEVFKKRLDG